MNENPFNDYSEAENYYEEESNSDLESRLYANIHYASVENETPDETSVENETPNETSVENEAPDETSVSPKILLKSTDNINDTNVLNNNEQCEASANKCADNAKSTGHNVCQSLRQNNDMVYNKLDKAICTNSTREICNINKDPYMFDANDEDQRVILPISRKKHKKNSKEEIKQKLLNFVLKVPNASQTDIRNNIRNSFVNRNNSKNSSVSNINSRKKHIESTQNKQDTENAFTKYQSSKQSLNKIYTEKHKEIEEMSTKYSVIEKKEKEKLQDIEHSNNAEERDSDSDSDQSILEVPIPPKPEPPLINLNDSDEETACTNNEDTMTKKPLSIENCNTIDFKNQVKRALSKSQLELISVDDSETLDNVNVTEDIILNCTEIQKGASSISEIREMRKDVQKKRKSHITEETGSSVLQESAKVNNNKGKSEKGDADANNKSLDDKDKNHLNKVINKERKKSICLTVNTNVDYAVDEFPADAFIRSQNKLNANKKRQLEYQQQNNDNIKRTKKGSESCQSEASTTNVLSKTQKNRDKSIDNSYFQSMSEKLKTSYTNSHGQENFDINEIQSKMSKDPRLWPILDEDLRPRSKKQRFWDIRCTHCQQNGHQRSNCPEPRKPPKCHMCGVQGHTEVRCPQKMCLTCGKRQDTFRKTCETCRTFYCTMCNAVGHKCTECPDLWRRYHQTTTDDVSIPRYTLGVMKPADRLSCCNCTKRGHDSSTCKDYRWSQHFPTPAFVSNYTDGPTYTEKQSQNISAQCLSDANIVQFKHGANNGKAENSITTVNGSDKILPFPKELLKKKQSKKKAFPQNIPQLIWESERNIAYVIYQCGVFYTIEEDGMEITYTITARKGFNTYNVMECRVIPNFLEKLLDLFRFEVKIYKEIGTVNELVLRIRTFADLINDLRRLILYWLSLEDDEKDYVIFLNLPFERKAMINILNSQIRKLGTEMGNPDKLYNTILTLKTGLENTRDQQKYDNMLTRLQDTQFKLLMILNDHPNLREVTKEIRKLVRCLEQSKSEDVPLQHYLQILTVYNFLFVPHTPPKSFITKYGKKSNPAVTFGKSTQKSKFNNTIPEAQAQVQDNSINSNYSETCKSVEVNSVQKDFQNMSNVTTKKYIPPSEITELSHNNIRFDNNVNQSNISENYRKSECNNPLAKTISQNGKFSDDFILNRDIIRYDTVSKSHDFLPIDTTSEKFTNITVNVLNKDQDHIADSQESNMNNFRNTENKNISKCTNITLNVSNKNRTDTAANFKSNIDDSENSKRQNTNKYTNITVSVSNKNQAHTTTSFQSNENNTKDNKHQNSNKYTNITVNVSGKNSTRTAVSTASNSNNSKNYDLQSSDLNNSNKNQYNNEDDIVCIEIKNNKEASSIKTQQTNKQEKKTKKNLKKEQRKKNKSDLTTRQLQQAIEKSSRLRLLSDVIKKGLGLFSSSNQDDWGLLEKKLRKLVPPCQIPHIKKAANALRSKIRERTQTRQDVYLLHRLVNVEFQHQEEMKRLFKFYNKKSNKEKNKGAKQPA